MYLGIFKHFKEICQSRGFKATSQRYIIFKTLLENPNHPTADHLFEQVAPLLPGLSRDTVYRTMNLLAKKGLVKKLAVPGEATHFDGNLSLHHHFICETCGVIYDLSWAEIEALAFPSEAFKLGTPHQVTVIISGLGFCCATGETRV